MWLAGFWRKLWSFVIFHLLKILFYKIKWEDRENIKLLKEHLKEGSVIIAFNHISLDDIVILLTVLYFEVGKSIKRMVVPASLRHWNEPLLGKIMRLSYCFGVEAFPIVQHYERDSVSSREIKELDRRFLSGAKGVLAKAGGMIIIAPEGHRGFGQLQSFTSGIWVLARIAKKKGFNAKVMMVGIEPPEDYGRRINLFKRFEIRFGTPLSIEEIEEKSEIRETSVIEFLREGVAELLSKEYSSLSL